VAIVRWLGSLIGFGITITVVFLSIGCLMIYMLLRLAQLHLRLWAQSRFVGSTTRALTDNSSPLTLRQGSSVITGYRRSHRQTGLTGKNYTGFYQRFHR